MTDVVFYFQAHQPYRLRPFPASEVGTWADPFDDEHNELVARRVSERCYVPMNELLLEAITANRGAFRCAFSVSGVLLDQLEHWVPEALDSFVRLADTGCVEFLGETSHHSLAYRDDLGEWEHQVMDQRNRIERLFGQRPTCFRNTELIISEAVARRIEALGFDVLLGEGADGLLMGRTPHRPWRPEGCQRLQLLLRDYVRSDDIAFRFSNREWDCYPLMADTFSSWLHALPSDAEFVGLFMDYETFGEHQAADTGIFDFMRALPRYVLANERFRFDTPTAVAARYAPAGALAIPRPVSWADEERDLGAWLKNPMQNAAHDALYALGRELQAAGLDPHSETLERWRRLTTSDHVYYMSTAALSDGDVHEYFSPYESPHAAFVNFMNVLDDLKSSLRRQKQP